MSWAIFVELLLVLMPYILKWLEELFARTAKKMGAVPEDPMVFRYEMDAFFNKAEEELWWWQFRKKAAIQAVRKVAVRRPDEFLTAMKTNVTSVLSPLTPGEEREVQSTLARTIV